MTDANSAHIDPNTVTYLLVLDIFKFAWLRTARAATEGSGAEGLMMPEGQRQAAPGLRR